MIYQHLLKQRMNFQLLTLKLVLWLSLAYKTESLSASEILEIKIIH